MATLTKVGEFRNYGANAIRLLLTEGGLYRFGFRNGTLRVIKPDGEEVTFLAPGIQDAFPLVIDGKVCVEYTQYRGYLPGTQQDDPTRDIIRLDTGIRCGQPVGGLGVVLTGPQGIPGVKGDQGIPGEVRTVTEVRTVSVEGDASKKLGYYPHEQGVTVRGHGDAIENNTLRTLEGLQYISNQLREVTDLLKQLIEGKTP